MSVHTNDNKANTGSFKQHKWETDVCPTKATVTVAVATRRWTIPPPQLPSQQLRRTFNERPRLKCLYSGFNAAGGWFTQKWLTIKWKEKKEKQLQRSIHNWFTWSAFRWNSHSKAAIELLGATPTTISRTARCSGDQEQTPGFCSRKRIRQPVEGVVNNDQLHCTGLFVVPHCFVVLIILLSLMLVDTLYLLNQSPLNTLLLLFNMLL